MAGSDQPAPDAVYCYKDRPSDANRNPTRDEDSDNDCKEAFIITMDAGRGVVLSDNYSEDANSDPEAEQYDDVKKFQKLPTIHHHHTHQRSLQSLDSQLSAYLSLSSGLKRIIVAVSCLFMAMLFNLTILAVIHERVPGTAPLPDIAFSLLPKIDRALDLSEYIIMFITTLLLIVIAFHRFRSILLRRLCLILSFLYVFRGICMGVTQLPVANPDYYCSPKLNFTSENDFDVWRLAGVIVSRVTHMSLGMGLSVNGRHSFCGDYIFSGHTLILVISYQFITEYWLDDRKIQRVHWRLLRYFLFLLITVGILGIVVARGHYLIDIVLAYYISTRVFLLYHKCCDDIKLEDSNCLEKAQPLQQLQLQELTLPQLSHTEIRTCDSKNRLSNLWWWNIFRFVEADTIAYRIPIENCFDLHDKLRTFFNKKIFS